MNEIVQRVSIHLSVGCWEVRKKIKNTKMWLSLKPGSCNLSISIGSSRCVCKRNSGRHARSDMSSWSPQLMPLVWAEMPMQQRGVGGWGWKKRRGGRKRGEGETHLSAERLVQWLPCIRAQNYVRLNDPIHDVNAVKPPTPTEEKKNTQNTTESASLLSAPSRGLSLRQTQIVSKGNRQRQAEKRITFNLEHKI